MDKHKLVLVLLVLWALSRKSDSPAPGGNVSPSNAPPKSPWTDDEMSDFAAMVHSAGVPPDVALSVYNYESALNPHAVNATSQAQGLAQMLPSTLKGLGYADDPTQFHTLGVQAQLPWISKLLASQSAALGSVPTDAAKLFHLQLSPANAKGALVISRSASPAAYEANKQLDATGKGYIDENDLRTALTNADTSPLLIGALIQLGRLMGANT